MQCTPTRILKLIQNCCFGLLRFLRDHYNCWRMYLRPNCVELVRTVERWSWCCWILTDFHDRPGVGKLAQVGLSHGLAGPGDLGDGEHGHHVVGVVRHDDDHWWEMLISLTTIHWHFRPLLMPCQKLMWFVRCYDTVLLSGSICNSWMC